jgi:hypothetical protein
MLANDELRMNSSTARFLPMKPNWKTVPGLGIDIGRVIIHGDGPDTSFVGAGSDEEAMAAPMMDGAFDAIARLVRSFGNRVWIVSKCGKRIEARSRMWLERQRFHELTGIPRDRLHFCRERKDKAAIALRLGIDWFIDDRIDVLRAMTHVPHRFLFGALSSPDAGIEAVANWAATEDAIDQRLRAILNRETAAEPPR